MADVKINVKIVSDSAQASVKKLNREVNKTEKGFKSLNVSVKQTASAFSSFVGNVAANAFSSAARGLVNLSTEFIKTAQSMETLTTQFEVLTGSAGNANAIVKELTDFTSKTPFRLEGVSTAAQRLLGFGFAADTVVDRLGAIGNVAAASNKPIQDIALIFGQVSAAGKLTGERLLQFQERAIPIGPAIAKTLGVAETSVKDLVTAGKVDFETFEKAFRSLSDEGEFAFDAIGKQSRTLAGRISTLQDNIQLLIADVSQSLAPVLKAVVTAFNELVIGVRESGSAVDGVNEALKGFNSTVDLIADSLIFVNDVIAASKILFNEYRTGVTLLADAALSGVQSLLEVARAAKEFLGLDTSNLDNQIETVKLMRETAQETAEEFQKANVKIAGSAIKTEEIIRGTSNRVKEIYAEETLAAQEKANATATANEQIIESETKRLTNLQLLEEASRARAAEVAEEDKLIAELREQEQFQALSDGLGEREAAREIARARELENEGKHAEAIAKLGEAQKKSEAKLSAAKIKENKQREANLKSSLGTIASLTSSSNKTLFAIGKAAAASQATLDGYAAVQKALTAAPPPFNFILAGLVGVASAANIAKIASSKPPAFENGGIVPGNSFSGDNVLARVNSGEMILNSQQQASLFNSLNSAGGTGGQEIVVNSTVMVNEDVLGRSVSRQVADGLILGEAE